MSTEARLAIVALRVVLTVKQTRKIRAQKQQIQELKDLAEQFAGQNAELNKENALLNMECTYLSAVLDDREVELSEFDNVALKHIRSR